MADSAIGGKTAVNTRHGKNLLGAFHRPEAVLIDLDTLATLPEVGAARRLCRDRQIWPDRRRGLLRLVRRRMAGRCSPATKRRGSTRSKPASAPSSSYVQGDERDTKGRRALLNFGHSFGHAIEAESGMAHGLAVAIGMAMALRLSHALGLCPAEDVARVAAHFAEVGLPTQPTGLDPARAAGADGAGQESG